MYKIFLLAALLACANAAPQRGGDADVQVTRFATQADTDGTYSYDVAKSDGSSISEKGQGGVYASGSFEFISPEGLPVQLSYVADENGFQPQSDWLPTPPPIPEEILQAIRFIQEHPTPEEQQDRLVRAQQL